MSAVASTVFAGQNPLSCQLRLYDKLILGDFRGFKALKALESRILFTRLLAITRFCCWRVGELTGATPITHQSRALPLGADSSRRNGGPRWLLPEPLGLQASRQLDQTTWKLPSRIRGFSWLTGSTPAADSTGV
jgi:hypothetical protein